MSRVKRRIFGWSNQILLSYLLRIATLLLSSGKAWLGETVDNGHNEIGHHGKDEELEHLANCIATLFVGRAGAQFGALFGEEELDWVGD